MSTPVVSVVIPAWNARDWIADAIGSITRQTYPASSMEVIVVDDGSTDGTAAVASSVLSAAGLQHTVVDRPDSTGPSAARNRGWRLARAPWVQFLDADDLLEPGKLAIQASVAVDAVGDVAVCHSPWSRIREFGGAWVKDAGAVDPVIGASSAVADLLVNENFVHISSQLVRRSWLERTGGFDETHRLVEDVEWLIRAAMLGGRILRVAAGEPLSWYRQRPRSLSRLDDQALVDACVRNARLVERRFENPEERPPAEARAVACAYFQAARFYSGVDRDRFDELVEAIYRVFPAFLPSGPPTLRHLSRAIGYSRAEQVAVGYRRFKALLPTRSH